MSEQNPTPESGPNDTIAANRSIAVVAAESIPQPPKGYKANVLSEPQLKTYYAAVERVFSARANAIREGISRKRAEKSAKEE
jgi:hypothetical protein